MQHSCSVPLPNFIENLYRVLTIFPIGRLYCSESLFNCLAAPLSETETALMEHWNRCSGNLPLMFSIQTVWLLWRFCFHSSVRVFSRLPLSLYDAVFVGYYSSLVLCIFCHISCTSLYRIVQRELWANCSTSIHAWHMPGTWDVVAYWIADLGLLRTKCTANQCSRNFPWQFVHKCYPRREMLHPLLRSSSWSLVFSLMGVWQQYCIDLASCFNCQNWLLIHWLFCVW